MSDAELPVVYELRWEILRRTSPAAMLRVVDRAGRAARLIPMSCIEAFSRKRIDSDPFTRQVDGSDCLAHTIFGQAYPVASLITHRKSYPSGSMHGHWDIIGRDASGEEMARLDEAWAQWRRWTVGAML